MKKEEQFETIVHTTFDGVYFYIGRRVGEIDNMTRRQKQAEEVEIEKILGEYRRNLSIQIEADLKNLLRQWIVLNQKEREKWL